LPHLLDEFVGCHSGRRCFVVGNGPSLNLIDMSKLSDEITFGANRCYLGYEKWGFPFTYWGIEDRLQIEEYGVDEYEANIPGDTVKFFPFEYLPLLNMENACPVNHLYDVPDFPIFSDSPDMIYLGNTVTYFLIQIAAIMGCDPIILVGVDHNYDLKARGGGGDVSACGKMMQALHERMNQNLRGNILYDCARSVNRAWQDVRRRHLTRKSFEAASSERRVKELWMQRDAESATHFDSRYTEGPQKRFVPPRPERAERAFACAQEWASRADRRIVNATPGTGLHTFPEQTFESLF
jgi:hypothetical protein